MTEERALEIIAACGADPARWPDTERNAVAALQALPAVAAAIADARALDGLLAGWATAAVVARPFQTPQVVAAAAPVPPAGMAIGRRWLTSGALATGALAAAVAAVVLSPMLRPAGFTASPAPQIAMQFPPSSVPSATAISENGSDADFAYVFTPTVDEDALI